MGPPIYEWYFGDLVEEHKHEGWATDVLVGFINQSPVRFTPGLDVSRTFDKTMFTGPDTQTVTVTVTPRDERIKGIEIFVHAEENELVSSTIISHSGSGEEQAHITPDGRYSEVGTPGMGIPVEPNVPVSITVVIQVNPKVPQVEYKPHVGIKPNMPGESYAGTSRGSAVSYANEAGTWTVSAGGSYVWEWAASKVPDYSVTLRKVANRPPALIEGGFSPFSGGPKTPFNFEVTYTDTERNPPSYVRVYIDDSAHDMTFWNGNYLEGALYRYTTTLSTGQHTYYFEASDGSSTVIFPENGVSTIAVTRFDFPVWIIIGTLAVVSVISFLIIGLVRLIRKRTRST